MSTATSAIPEIIARISIITDFTHEVIYNLRSEIYGRAQFLITPYCGYLLNRATAYLTSALTLFQHSSDRTQDLHQQVLNRLDTPSMPLNDEVIRSICHSITSLQSASTRSIEVILHNLDALTATVPEDDAPVFRHFSTRLRDLLTLIGQLRQSHDDLLVNLIRFTPFRFQAPPSPSESQPSPRGEKHQLEPLDLTCGQPEPKRHAPSQ